MTAEARARADAYIAKRVAAAPPLPADSRRALAAIFVARLDTTRKAS